MSENEKSRRQIYKIFAYIFGGICAICLLFWVLVYAVPIVEFQREYGFYPPNSEEVWTEPLFIAGIISLVVASIFDHLAGPSEEEKRKREQELKLKEMKLQKKLTAKGIIPEQQQQQLVVNIPQPYVPQPEPARVPGQPVRPFENIKEAEPIDGVYCIRCGSKNVKFAKFCKVCGATIE